MLPSNSRLSLYSNLWLATIIVISSGLMALGARWSTTTVLFVLGVTPFIVIRIIGFRPPPATVAQVLYDVEHPAEHKR
jgi:hypothetical protein